AEAPVHQNVKHQIVANSELSTQLVFRKFRNTARVARNAIYEQIVEISQRPGATFEDIAHLASGERGRHAVLTEGDMDGGMWWAGMSQGLITSVAGCREVVDEIIREAEDVVRGRLAEMIESQVSTTTGGPSP